MCPELPLVAAGIAKGHLEACIEMPAAPSVCEFHKLVFLEPQESAEAGDARKLRLSTVRRSKLRLRCRGTWLDWGQEPDPQAAPWSRPAPQGKFHPSQRSQPIRSLSPVAGAWRA